LNKILQALSVALRALALQETIWLDLQQPLRDYNEFESC